MEKYRLIKEYPGSPKLGTIVMNGIIGVCKGNPNLSFDGSRRLRDIELPQKYPEFWEKIVEKEYEILSVSWINKVNTEIVNITDDIQFKTLYHDGYDIHSVKRLKDNVIFTIKDEIITPVTSNRCIIKKFKLFNNNIFVDYYWKKYQNLFTDNLLSINVIIKCKSEEIIKKDYKILSYYNPERNNYVFFKDLNNPENNKWWTLYKKCYINITNTKYNKIYSVKRLSDGEIFTVGDKVIHTNNVSNRNGIIKMFHIMSNGIWFKTDNYDVPMCFIQNKYKKQPLFKTEDGVDIFEDDEYWALSTNLTSILQYIANRWITNGYKRFSTKETAEKYILMNKPCLSINDVKKAMKEGLSLEGYLTKLVKSKL